MKKIEGKSPRSVGCHENCENKIMCKELETGSQPVYNVFLCLICCLKCFRSDCLFCVISDKLDLYTCTHSNIEVNDGAIVFDFLNSGDCTASVKWHFANIWQHPFSW